MPSVFVPLRIQNAADFAHALVGGDAGMAIVAKANLSGFELADVSDAATLGGHLPAYFLPAADFDPADFEAAGAVTAGIEAHVALADPHGQYALESALGTMATQAEANYLLATGARTGASAAIQPFTLGIQTGKIVVPTAFGLYRADGTTQDYFYNSVTGRHGFGAASSAGVLEVSGTAYPVAIINRVSTGSAATQRVSLGVRHTTDIDMTDGFGAGFTFEIRDNAGVDNPIAQIFANRSGADNTGAMSFWTYEAGTATERMRITAAGALGIGIPSPAAQIEVRGSDTGTTNILTTGIFNHTSSGTPAAGFGVGVAGRLKSSTTTNQDAGRLTWQWITATHASRASKGQLSAYYIATERPAISWGADAAGPLLGFGAVTTPIAIQVLATGSGATVDNVISALQALGLVKQS